MGRLEGKVAVVTGAGNGIGRATAIRFAKEGAKVVLTTRQESHGEATLAEIKKAGGEAIFVQSNTRQKEDVNNYIDKAKETYGKLDILVNCAGVLVHKPFLEHTDEDLDTIFETNFRGHVWAMQRAIPYMQENGSGSIVNVASISVMKPELMSYYYGAFKAALNKLSIDVAKEFAPEQIRVNVVCPGPVQTGLTPDYVNEDEELKKWMLENLVLIGRFGQSDDIANMNLFLASDEASWITGSTFVVDGGVTISG